MTRPSSFEALTPTSFLRRAEAVHAEQVAVVDGDRRVTYRELGERCRRLAGGLRSLADGAPVASLAPNGLMALEAHYGAPWSGSPLVALNTRLTPSDLAGIVEHAGATVLLHGPEHRQAAAEITRRVPALRLVCDDEDPGDAATTYEALVAGAEPYEASLEDERALLSLNYTSGTTGRPKGVMYHHRGAYLQALAMAFHNQLDVRSAYLWTLPMFHCNGWCFTWAVTAAGATHVCLPKVDPEAVWQHIDEHRITHLSGAPTVLTALAEAEGAHPLDRPLRVATGGAPPSPAILARFDALGIEVTHLYGLTETFGPSVLCEWQPAWDDCSPAEQSRLRARQGVGNVISSPLRVLDADGRDVPADGATIGEVALRGNNVMLGYYKDEAATAAAAPDGWFRTGDLAVRHPDGYLELKDRSKDVIISGGENISSVEVERALAEHPAVLEVAVVAAPHERWGEVPVAFVHPRAEPPVTEAELIAFARDHLAHFKAPKKVVLGPLPTTSTGKVQKFRLREDLRSQGPLDTS